MPKSKSELLAKCIVEQIRGEVSEAWYASGISPSIAQDKLCIGDFRAIGWSERVTTRDTWCYRWLGPGKIHVAGTTYSYGEYLEEIEVSYD